MQPLAFGADVHDVSAYTAHASPPRTPITYLHVVLPTLEFIERVGPLVGLAVPEVVLVGFRVGLLVGPLIANRRPDCGCAHDPESEETTDWFDAVPFRLEVGLYVGMLVTPNIEVELLVVGDTVGMPVGLYVVGDTVGSMLGDALGLALGEGVGATVGAIDGLEVGTAVGLLVGL